MWSYVFFVLHFFLIRNIFSYLDSHEKRLDDIANKKKKSILFNLEQVSLSLAVREAGASRHNGSLIVVAPYGWDKQLFLRKCIFFLISSLKN